MILIAKFTAMKRIICKTIIAVRTLPGGLAALLFGQAKGLARFVIALAVLLCFSACSFNSQFLKPAKFPANTTSARLAKAGGDSIIVFFSPANHQPVFTKNGTDILNLPFTIESVVFKSANGNLLNERCTKTREAIFKHRLPQEIRTQ